MQYGRAVLYYNGARGTISNNSVYDFQKNGIEVSGQAADGSVPSSLKTSVTVANNIVTGNGPIDYIAQNGIVIRSGADAVVKGNTVTNFEYTPASTEATGLLNYQAGTIAVSGNTFARNEVNVEGAVKTIHNVHGRYATTIRPNRLRIDFRSEAQPANTVIGNRLHWVVKVDGRTRLDMRQGFGEHDVFSRYVTHWQAPRRGLQERRGRQERRRQVLTTPTPSLHQSRTPVSPGFFDSRERLGVAPYNWIVAVRESSRRMRRSTDAADGSPRRALVLHDTALLVDLIELTLNHGLFVVRAAQDLTQAEAILDSWSPNIGVLDMDNDASPTLLQRVGATGALAGSAMPVLGLTRRGDLKTKLKAFDLGVDDILTVPFSPEELLARCMVLARRALGTDRPIVPTISIGEIELDIVNRQVRAGTSVVHLSGIEQSLLYLLASRGGRVLTRDEILDAIWGTDFVAESNVVDRHIRTLRIKLQNDYRRPRFIETVPGIGYRFIPTFSNAGWREGGETS